MAATYRSIARIEKTHGRNGEVVAVPAHGLPLVLRKGMRVALVPPALKGPRWRVVEGCSAGGSGQLVSFGGVSSLAEAAELVGKTVLARRDDLPDDLDLHDADALLGREVTDESAGPLGVIEEVMRGPANDVWVVRGPLGEVLVPVVAEFVRSSGREGPIVVALPAGLAAAPVEGGEGRA